MLTAGNALGQNRHASFDVRAAALRLPLLLRFQPILALVLSTVHDGLCCRRHAAHRWIALDVCLTMLPIAAISERFTPFEFVFSQNRVISC